MRNGAVLVICGSLLSMGGCSCDVDEGLFVQSGLPEADPTIVEFGAVGVGSVQTRAIRIKNVGGAFLSLSDPTVGPAAFSVAQSPTTEPIPPANETTLVAAFSPQEEGPFEGKITIEHDGSGDPVEIILIGSGTTQCALTVAPTGITFPTPAGQVGSESVNVSTTTGCSITSLTLEGADAAQFTLADANPFELGSGENKALEITLDRSNPQAVSAQLVIVSDDPSSPHVVNLSAGVNGPGLCVRPTNIQFGAVQGSATQDVTIEACGQRDIQITALDWTMADPEVNLTNAPTLPFPLAAGATQNVTVEYRPTDDVDDTAVLRVASDDAILPSVDVTVSGSRDLVPEEVGRFLYFWSIQDTLSESNIMKVPLQGGGAAAPFWGQSTGRISCPGCHQVSSDGRYIAIVDIGILGQILYIVDAQTNRQIILPTELRGGSTFSWRPDVGGSEPYSFVAGVEGDLQFGSVGGGYLGPVAGGSDPSYFEGMPTWGPDGNIVFVRGQEDTAAAAAGIAYNGPTDLMRVAEAGGTADFLPGASQNGAANYYPAYAPTGLWIAFTKSAAAGSTYAANDARVELVSTDLTGTVLPLDNLNAPGYATSFPTWSIDGTYLSISSDRPGGVGSWDVYIAPVDPVLGTVQGSVINLTTANTSGFEHAAQWSP